jgi:acetyl-CoA C-acetyltransferase
VVTAANAIQCGQGELFLAGGVESMTRGPFAIAKSEAPYTRDFKVFDTSLGARFPNPCFVVAFGNDGLAETADNVAKEVGVTRNESDVFALASQTKYAQAKAAGYFRDELMPVPVPVKKAPPIVVEDDEHPRPETTAEALAKLHPLFPGGVTTAGSASGINDGAAALIVGSADVGEKYGVKPLARFITGATAGVAPRVMGLGPVPSTRKCLERAGLSLKDIDVIEINEAFAAQVLGCLKQMGIAYDDSRVNPNGGAIAIGHPLGASGARLTITAIRQLAQQSGRYALVTACIGVGQGMTAVFERV